MFQVPEKILGAKKYCYDKTCQQVSKNLTVARDYINAHITEIKWLKIHDYVNHFFMFFSISRAKHNDEFKVCIQLINVCIMKE